MSRALVVDDHEAACELISEGLRERGISVECVRDDTSAYRRIAALPTLDLLIPDVNLCGGTTGYDVARFARQVIPHIAVVYVSGEVDPTSFQAFGVPNSDFVEKPFTPDEIGELVMAKLQPAFH